MFYDAEDNKEELSLGHEGKLLSSNISESSDNKDEGENRTGAKYINGNIRGDSNNGAGGGSLEWLSFLSPGARTE